MSTEDLLDHFKLEAEVFPTHTIHTSYLFNRRRRLREKTKIQWDRIERVGQGQFGEVWKEARSQPDGSQTVRAIKAIEKQRMSGLNVDIKKEILALAKLAKEEYRQAEVFVSFFGWFDTDSTVFLAMEYLEQGDLSHHIPRISTENEVRQIAIDLLEGLRIMHAEGFAHRDLKPKNIFVVECPPQAERWWVKIGDFGISKRVKNEDTALRTQTGTRHFQAPEILGFVDEENESSVYSNAVDMWSLGCIIYNLAAQRVPFPKPHEVNGFCQKRIGFPEGPLRATMDSSGLGFVQRLLTPDPTQRPSAAQALEDPWTISKDDCAVQQHQQPSGSRRSSHQDTAIPVAPIQLSLDREANQNLVASISELEILAANDSAANDSAANDLAVNDLAAIDASIFSTETEIPGRTNEAEDFFVDWVNGVDPYAVTPFVGRWTKAFWLYVHSQINCVSFRPGDDRFLWTGSRDGSLRCWGVTDGNSVIRHLPGTFQDGPIKAIVCLPQTQKMAYVGSNGTLKFVDLQSGSVQFVDDLHFRVESIAIRPDQKYFAAGCSDREVRLFRCRTFDPLLDLRGTLRGHTRAVGAVTFSPDGRLLASGSVDKNIRLWTLKSDRGDYPCQELRGHTSQVVTLAFSPDGRTLASGSTDTTIRLWNVENGVLLTNIEGHAGTVWDLDFSPNGRIFASGSADGTIEIWDLESRRNCRTLSGHAGPVYAVAFSADGRIIASGSADGHVGIWYDEDLLSLTELSSLPKHPNSPKVQHGESSKRLRAIRKFFR